MAARERKQVLLRLDPAVHAAVAKWAADELRSVNAQIEVILRRALTDAGRGVRAAPMRGRGRPRKEASGRDGEGVREAGRAAVDGGRAGKTIENGGKTDERTEIKKRVNKITDDSE
nr:hypothetical protein [Actinomyces sp. HMT897]